MDLDSVQKLGALGIVAYLAYWVTTQAPTLCNNLLSLQSKEREMYREELREERLQCHERLADERAQWANDRKEERELVEKKFIEAMGLVRQGQQTMEAYFKREMQKP